VTTCKEADGQYYDATDMTADYAYSSSRKRLTLRISPILHPRTTSALLTLKFPSTSSLFLK